jgi:hypothetical protein
MYLQPMLAPILDAAHDVINDADDSGCGGDLTVTSRSSVERLNHSVLGAKLHDLVIVMHHHDHGVSTRAILVPKNEPFDTDDAVACLAEDFEPEREEWIEIVRFDDSEIVVRDDRTAPSLPADEHGTT